MDAYRLYESPTKNKEEDGDGGSNVSFSDMDTSQQKMPYV